MIRRDEFNKIPFKPGDVIGFSGKSWESAFVNVCSYGIPWFGTSHVGILAQDPKTKKLLLWESTTLGELPCIIKGKKFAGTQAHDLYDVVKSYDGFVYHYQLYRTLYRHESKRLSQFLVGTLGIPYDLVGALRSGGFGYSMIESIFRRQDLASIFCSEWCAAALACIGVFRTTNASRWSPNVLVRSMRKGGIIKKPRRIK